MRKQDVQLGVPFVDFTDTKANVEAIVSPIGGMTAYASDTGEAGYYDGVGAAWVWGSGGGGVQSVTGDGVDNADPLNPVMAFPTPSAIGAEPAKGDDDNYVTDAEKIIIGNTSGTNTGDSATPAETAITIGALIGSAGDATPNDTDFVATALTAGGLLQKITWANVKVFLKTYFDGVYAALAGLSTQVFSVAAATAVAHAVRADQIQMNSLGAYTTGGTQTAYTLTTLGTPIALTTGERWTATFNATAGSNPTLNRDSKGAKALKFYTNLGVKAACSATTIKANMISDVIYDGTDYVLAGRLPQLSEANYADLVAESNSALHYHNADKMLAFFGDGSDGDMSTLDLPTMVGTTTSDGVTFTMTRDIYPNSLVIYSPAILITAGFRIFAKTQVENQGTIHNNGSDAVAHTAGAGALGGFFKAGGAGATGAAAATAGTNGTAPTAPTAATFVGAYGGRGAAGHVSILTFEGVNASIASIFPAEADGGYRSKTALGAYLHPFYALNTTTQWQMTPSIGGGSGAKSVIGTAARPGGGGGGGGVVFIASPYISGLIEAKGGAGGDAAGTNANLGGGGGGGGGIVCLICNNPNTDRAVDVSGGLGGASVTDDADAVYTVAVADVTTTGTTAVITLPPTACWNRNTLYMIAVHIQHAAATVSTIEGFGFSTFLIAAVNFNSIASPARRLELWGAFRSELTPPTYNNDGLYFPNLTVSLSDAPTACRIMVDGLQNVGIQDTSEAPIVQYKNNATDSGTTLTVTLDNAISTVGNMVYSVFARAGGTLPVAGAGNTLLNNETVAPILVSEVSIDRTDNTMTNTTATAIAAISAEIAQPSAMESGVQGWDGSTIVLAA